MIAAGFCIGLLAVLLGLLAEWSYRVQPGVKRRGVESLPEIDSAPRDF